MPLSASSGAGVAGAFLRVTGRRPRGGPSLSLASVHGMVSRDGTSSLLPVPSGHLGLTGLGCERLTVTPAQLRPLVADQ